MYSSLGQLEALEVKQSRNSWVCEDMDLFSSSTVRILSSVFFACNQILYKLLPQ